jgi:NTE family protein
VSGPRTALVLSGGGARGAYEAGVLRYLRGEIAHQLGGQPRFEILSGTSIGAVNACFLASTAHVLEEQAERLAEVWLSLRLEEVFHWSALALGRLPGYLYRRIKAVRHRTWRLADLLWPEALARTVRQRVVWSRLHANLEEGRVGALTVTATDLGTGRAVVFVETAGTVPPWGRDPLVEVRRVSIRPEHVLASGAIPLLFRPVRIDGSWFVDGSVRQTTPIAPAIRLGADRVLVIGLRSRAAAPSPGAVMPHREPTTAAQLGRVLSALLVDRADADLDRLRRLNEVLEDGERAFGPGFAERIAAISSEHGAAIRRVQDLVIRPSVDPAIVAREHARRRVKRLRRGTLAARLLARAAADEGATADGFAELASLLLFDREYAAELLALGRADAERQRDALLAFFAPGERRGA